MRGNFRRTPVPYLGQQWTRALRAVSRFGRSTSTSTAVSSIHTPERSRPRKQGFHSGLLGVVVVVSLFTVLARRDVVDATSAAEAGMGEALIAAATTSADLGFSSETIKG